jgi:hypothetical protein
VTSPGASWEKSPRKPASLSSNGRTSANSCWQPSTVHPFDWSPIQPNLLVLAVIVL